MTRCWHWPLAPTWQLPARLTAVRYSVASSSQLGVARLPPTPPLPGLPAVPVAPPLGAPVPPVPNMLGVSDWLQAPVAAARIETRRRDRTPAD